MRSRCSVVVVVFLSFLGPVARADEHAEMWPVNGGPRHRSSAEGDYFAQLQGQLVLLQLGVDRPGAGTLLLQRRHSGPWGGLDTRTLQVEGGAIPERHVSAAGWATQLTFGTRYGDDEKAFELRYLDGSTDGVWGLSGRLGYTRRWQAAGGLFGLYAGGRAEVTGWEVSLPANGHLSYDEYTWEPMSYRRVEEDVRTTLRQDVILYAIGLEVGVDWRRPLGPGLDLVCRGRLSPLYTKLSRTFQVPKGFGPAAKLSAGRSTISYALAGMGDVGLAWSVGAGVTFQVGARLDGLGTFSRGATLFTESLYLGIDLAF